MRHSVAIAWLALAVLAVLVGCGDQTDTGTGPAGTGPADSGSQEQNSFEVLTTGRLAEAPGGEEFDGVHATVLVSEAELDTEWPNWKPLGAKMPTIDGLGTDRSLVLLWAEDHPVRVSHVTTEDGRLVVEGTREIPGEGCSTTQEVTGWTTVVSTDTVPSEPDDLSLRIDEETIDC